MSRNEGRKTSLSHLVSWCGWLKRSCFSPNSGISSSRELIFQVQYHQKIQNVWSKVANCWPQDLLGATMARRAWRRHHAQGVGPDLSTGPLRAIRLDFEDGPDLKLACKARHLLEYHPVYVLVYIRTYVFFFMYIIIQH